MANLFIIGHPHAKGRAVPCAPDYAANRLGPSEHVLELLPLSNSAGKAITGCRRIIIDGLQWGRLWMESRGAHGQAFIIQDVRGWGVKEPVIGGDGKPVLHTTEWLGHKVGDPVMATAQVKKGSDAPDKIASLFTRGLFPDPSKIEEMIRADNERREREHAERHRKLDDAIKAVAGMREAHGFDSGTALELAFALAVLRRIKRTGEFTIDTTLTDVDFQS